MDKLIPIYIIIVTYNGSPWIHKCIQSALSSDIPINIIIIDNGSTDNTLRIIRDFHAENIQIIETGNNLGFGKANNIGIKKAMDAGAEYIYLLNQDAYLKPNTISGLVKLMTQDHSYAILSPMQYNGDGTKLDKNFEDIYLHRTHPSATIPNVLDAEFVMAAHWLIQVNVLKKLGTFNPIFLHYGEDGDMINRIFFHNFKLGIAIKLTGFHDREFRLISYKKEIAQSYMSHLAVATNPNLPGPKTIFIFTKFIINDLIKRIKLKQFEAFKVHFNNLYYILKNGLKIYYSREKCFKSKKR